MVGSATAQQIIRKNNEVWKSFFALLKAYKAGKIEDRFIRRATGRTGIRVSGY